MSGTRGSSRSPPRSPQVHSADSASLLNGNLKHTPQLVSSSPRRSTISTDENVITMDGTANGESKYVPAHFQVTNFPCERSLSVPEIQNTVADGNKTGQILSDSGRVSSTVRTNSLKSEPLHLRRASESYNASSDAQPVTPPVVPRNVQFHKDTLGNGQTNDLRSRPPSLGERIESQSRSQLLMSKLKALRTSPTSHSHPRSSSGVTPGALSSDNVFVGGLATPRFDRNEGYFPVTLEEDGSEADADVEESATEHNTDETGLQRKRRKTRGIVNGGGKSAPTTPRSVQRPGSFRTHSVTSSDHYRPHIWVRSATTNDVSTSPKVKEELSDDGSVRRNQGVSVRNKKNVWLGLPNPARKASESGTAEGRRPRNLRALTHIGSPKDSKENGEAGPSRTKLIAERGTTLSSQKWRQIKQGLRLLGQSKKKEQTIDHEKSAELLAELLAGSPAALMFASMFQRDEHGSKRIPILLEQLKVRITDSAFDKYRENDNPTPGDRHIIFRIELEYGNGVNRMRWVVRRSLGDFARLHVKYKLHFSTEKYVKLRTPDNKKIPRFPKGAFPYLKAYRGLEDEGEDDDDDIGNETEGGMTDTERPGHRKRRSSLGLIRHRTNASGAPASPGVGASRAGADGAAGTGVSGAVKRETYPERQRRKLEVYLQKMIKFMLFRPDSNRLCKFLEVSAMGMRLAAEGSYHGKEGFLTIQSAAGLDFRKALTPSNIIHRHRPKWFLVRHSYVVCVDSPEDMHIYDVFLFDSDFQIQPQQRRIRGQKAEGMARSAKESAKHPQHHRLKVQNSERKLKLIAQSERQLHQFEDSIRTAVEASPWAKMNRFEGFAPVRQKCFAQWLVDGRDHMWVVSRAINQAKDVIYIHDWWLSPELYMRRPAAISQKWRLDRLLKRKAEQGIKVFVIVYRNIESAVPIDSQYTKFSLLDLHPNVFVQRSPNQFRQNTFFWAHHEKLCIVDHTLAFVGGIDLCFGRWDTPQHTVVDDKPTGFEVSDQPKDADHCQLWPGKDYSNPRVQDFFALNKPYEEMYERSQVARMPWHDISMQVVGQPARDLTRHFVQRWNYILRQRKPTRPTPFLLPPPDFNPADLEALGLDGTCEVQIVRSAGPWSIGTPDKTEHSIMNAYIKMIEESEHFVYIENQFFISSCETEATTIHNSVGDALVERITRAAKNEDAWHCCIIIPLIPGFQNTVEQEGGTSVRLIMQYQYRSICRGESSIFGRLRAQGIEPEDYIQFYALRQWGKIGPKKQLITEQLYIHAKCMIVDDRVAIIGSANINERSMLGNRDSECAAVVRDTDMIKSRMNGKEYMVGRFPHSLRVRLMREHLGLDVDKIMEDAQLVEAEIGRSSQREPTLSSTLPQDDRSDFDAPSSQRVKSIDLLQDSTQTLLEGLLDRSEELNSFNHDVDWEQAENPNLKTNRRLTVDPRVTGNKEHHKDVEGGGEDNMTEIQSAGYGVGRDSILVRGNKEILISDIANEGKASMRSPLRPGQSQRKPTFLQKFVIGNPPLPPRPEHIRMSSKQLGLPTLSQLPELPATDDSDIGGPAAIIASPGSTEHHHPLVSEIHKPYVDKDCMQDPMHDAFMVDTWHALAENNTKIYRTVFRCMPDNEVKSWKEYKEYVAYEERFKEMQGSAPGSGSRPPSKGQTHPLAKSGPPGAGLLAGPKKPMLGVIGETPHEVEKKTFDLAEKIIKAIPDAISGGDKEEQANQEKERLRNWAADANRAQAERQGRKLAKQEAFPAFDEKAGPETTSTIPEPHTTDSNPDGYNEKQGDIAEDIRPTSANITTTAALSEKSPPTNLVGYSEALNTNLQSSAGHKRRRRTTTSGRRQFNASDDILSVGEAEELLNLVQGHLVLWPYEWYLLHIYGLSNSCLLTQMSGWRKSRLAAIGCFPWIRYRQSRSSEKPHTIFFQHGS